MPRSVAPQRHRAHLDHAPGGLAVRDVVGEMGIAALADAIDRRHHLGAVVRGDDAIELGADQIFETLDAEEPKGTSVGRENRPVVRRDRQAHRSRLDDQTKPRFRGVRRRGRWHSGAGSSSGLGTSTRFKRDGHVLRSL